MKKLAITNSAVHFIALYSGGAEDQSDMESMERGQDLIS